MSLPTPTSSAPQPAMVQTGSRSTHHLKLRDPTSPKEGPCTQHLSEPGDSPTLPKTPHSQDTASPVAGGDGGAATNGAAGDEPSRRAVLWGRISFHPSVDSQRFVLSPGLSSQTPQALPKPKLILLQQLFRISPALWPVPLGVRNPQGWFSLGPPQATKMEWGLSWLSLPPSLYP